MVTVHLPVFVNIAPYSVLWKSLQHICHYTENKQHNTGWLVISFNIFNLEHVKGKVCTGDWMKSVVFFFCCETGIGSILMQFFFLWSYSHRENKLTAECVPQVMWQFALLVMEQMCSVFSEAETIFLAQVPPQCVFAITAFSTQKYSTPKLGLLHHSC